jgi:hypothetical protein
LLPLRTGIPRLVCRTDATQRSYPLNFDAPLIVKPPPVPEAEHEADIIGRLSGENLELREALADAREKLSRRTASADKPIVLQPIDRIVALNREPLWLIEDVLEQGVLAVLAGPRGTLKSFVALDWAMRVATHDEGWLCVILSAEGQGLGNRAAAWMNQHFESGDLADVRLRAYELPINLNSVVELEKLRQVIEDLEPSPALIVIDTFSKFSAGIDENSNGEVARFLSGLSSLREEFGSTVLMVAHSGHGKDHRPRGANALMSNPDCEYIVERNGMTVTVTRDRFKDTPSLPPLAYEAKVIDLGRTDRRGRPVTSLALVSSETPAREPPAKGNGPNQRKVTIALKEWIRAHPDQTILSTIDLREICKAQKVDRRRQSEVVTSFVANRVLTPSVGGWLLHGENL